MRTTKIRRLIAFLLVLLMFVGGWAIPTGAKTDEDAESALNSIKELLNAVSYSEYQDLELFKEAQNATSEILISGADGVYTNSAGDIVATDGTTITVDSALKDKYPTEAEMWDAIIKSDNKTYKVDITDRNGNRAEGLYIPDSGVVEWTFDLAVTTKYNIHIEYYPVANKSASVERILLINGKVPFAEARYLDISKVWTTPYPLSELELDDDLDPNAIKNEAIAAGFEQVSIKKQDGANYLVCKMPEAWTKTMSKFVDDYDLRFFRDDIDNNEIRESLTQSPIWQTYSLKDSNGFVQQPFIFAVEPGDDGKARISLEGVNEPIVISNIKLTPITEYQSYAEYAAQHADKPDGTGSMKIEAEYFSATSNQTIYPTADTTSAANSPVATDKTYLNVVGGEKWQGVGQWIEYDFTVSKSGMYNIAMRYKQNILDGMSVCRMLYLYSDDSVQEGAAGYYNGIPFDEATRLKFNFSDDWQAGKLSDGTTDFEFYFEEGVTYKLRLEVSLGAMGDIVRRVQEALDAINADYLNILKLTGTTPDEFRNYNFYRTIPKTMGDMYDQYEAIAKEDENGDYVKGTIVADILKDSDKSSMTATLINVAELLKEMASDEEEVAKNMEQLKTYIGSLGTWIGDAKTQPLLVDYITIQAPSEEVPEASAGFFEGLWHEISGFFQSFFRKYDRMGALTDDDTEESVEVWLAYGRDQSQVIRNLINNNFTPKNNVTVNLKLVAGGTLLPSILSGQGPDVYLGLGAGDVINYSIRGALESIEKLEGYDEVYSNFNESAKMVLQIECAGTNGDAEEHQGCGTGKMHCYGLPETQSFAMMFVRNDILAELDLEVPKTWNDVKEAVPVLQANNMEIAMINDSNIFLYQMGGDLFADGGMRINLDSNLALTAFENMCEMFTMYSFPYQYNFANRFRTGEMPIGFADYTGTYNHLKVFATEIEGLWSFYPLPGIEDKNGNINFQAVSGVSAVVMIGGTDKKQEAWEFMKWYVGAECQTDYSNEMVAILGPSAKHPTANGVALESLPWTRQEYEQIKLQFDNLAAIPNYPGAYIIGRYTGFAFLDAYNDNLNPVESLLGYIDYINDEITRKRDEFDLETLDKNLKQSTLAIKRMQQAETELERIKTTTSYLPAYDALYNSIWKELRDYSTQDYGALESLAAELREKNAKLFEKAADYLDQAAQCLRSYEAYK